MIVHGWHEQAAADRAELERQIAILVERMRRRMLLRQPFSRGDSARLARLRCDLANLLHVEKQAADLDREDTE